MKKILIIEDNTYIRENLEELFMLANYEVITAVDGAIGIDLAIADQPDLILCDIAMPEKNGYQVLDALKEHLSTKEIPFIFLTASAQEKDIAMGKSSRADLYLTKPFESEELLAVISGFCNKTIQ